MKEQLRILADAASMSPQGFERIEGLRRVVYDGEDYPGGIRAFKEKPVTGAAAAPTPRCCARKSRVARR